MFEFSQLRCFVVAATELNFRRAATLLNMTQPPLSRQIQLLEHALGVKLFQRDSSKVTLTTAGQRFLVDATRLLNLAEQAANSARRVSKGESGRIAIGFTTAAGYEMVPGLLAAARQELPDIDVVLKEIMSSAQVGALANNEIDIGFMRPLYSRQKLDFLLVSREPMMVALPAGHPLAECESFDLHGLNGQPFIMPSPNEGKYFHHLIMGLFGSLRIMPDYIQYIDQTHAMVSHVRAGLGIAILPASAQRFHFNNVEFRAIQQESPMAEMSMVWNPEQRNPAVATFIRFAEKFFRCAQTPSHE